MNASLDSMVTVVISHVQQTVILMSVTRLLVIVVEVVLLDFMVICAHKSALRIAKTLANTITVLVIPVELGIMGTYVQISAAKIAKMVVIT